MPSTSRRTTLTIVGAGAVGTAFAHALSRNGYSILEVCSLRTRSARQLARFFPSARVAASAATLARSPKIMLLCVPDQEIVAVVHELCSNNAIDLSRTTILHTSGVLGADVCDPLKGKAAAYGSLHPIQLFPRGSDPMELGKRINGISFGYEGGPRARRSAQAIVRALSGRLISVPKEGKILYHLTCVFASNFAVALIEAINRSSRHVGGGFQVKDVEQLMRSSINSAFQVGPSRALTGPMVRGSVETVRLHVQELRRSCTELLPSYQALGSLALKLSKEMGYLDKRTSLRLAKALHSSSQRKRSLRMHRQSKGKRTEL